MRWIVPSGARWLPLVGTVGVDGNPKGPVSAGIGTGGGSGLRSDDRNRV